MIECNNVSFRYQNNEADALKAVNLQIIPGECVVCCGKICCGKSLLKNGIHGTDVLRKQVCPV